MFLLHLKFHLLYVPPNQISKANWFRPMCILLISSHKLSKTSSSVVSLYSGPSGILVSAESRRPFKPVLKGMRNVALSI